MSSSLDSWGLKELVALAGNALQKEDQGFRNDLLKNEDCPGQHGGLLRIMNERYYQFVVARYFSAYLPYIVKVEDSRRDLTLIEQNKEPFFRRYAAIEMKCWFSATGLTELPGIKEDLFVNLVSDITRKEENSFQAEHGFMFLFSANPPGQMQDNLKWISGKLGLRSERWETFCFETETASGSEDEFWVAGYDAAQVLHQQELQPMSK